MIPVMKTTANPLVTVLVMAAWLFAGCTFAMRTNIATLDSTPRPPTKGDVEVFLKGRQPTRRYKEIALYTLASHGGEEANAVQGFVKLARKQGADALLMDGMAVVLQGQRDENMKGGGVANFRATAIVWTEQK
jgi:hypothetical protein